MRIPGLQKAFYLAVITLATSVVTVAQDAATGAITGTVVDATGAIVPHADVVAVASATHQQRTLRTTQEGIFRIPLLAPGKYEITVAADTFQSAHLQDVSVAVSETTALTVKLVAGSVQQIDVHQAQSDTMALGRVVDEETIQQLPLANRNFTQLLALSPGVVTSLAVPTALGRNNQNVSANGSGTTFNNFQFNGVDANNLAQNSASGYQAEVGLAVPAPDVIQEFKVQTGGYDASYGRGAGANVDVITRSGGNRFHGSAWEFFRNDVLNANDYFAKRNGQKRPVVKQNQFGGTLGGPITRNKLFFFAAYQGTIQRNGASNLSLVNATLPQLTDDRSAATLGAQFCPANHPANQGYLTVAGGSQVACNGSNINPVALKLLNFKFSNGQYAIPTPQTNLSGTAPDQLPIGQSTFSIPARYREDQITASIDQVVTPRNQWSGRFFYSRSPTVEPFSPYGANVPGWGTQELDQNHLFVLSDTQMLSPNLVNVARVGYARFDGFAHIDQPIMASDVGMATPGSLPQTPGLQVAGLFTIGTAGQPFYWQNTNTYVVQDTLSWTRGRHSLRMGGEVKRHQVDINVPFVNDGFIYIASFADFLVGQSSSQNGSPVSNLTSVTASSGIFRKDERYVDVAGFLQDDWKVTHWLTLSAGLRYEFFGPPSDIHGRLPTFDPYTASPTVPSSGSLSGFILPANYNGPLPDGAVKSHHNGLWANQYKDISPRFGFAARLPGGRTYLRGGYGIYFDRVSADLAEQTVGQPPYSFKQSLGGAQNADSSLQQPYAPPLPPTSAFPLFLPRVPGGGLSLASISPNILDPYTQVYNLNVQYELAKQMLAEIGYVGSKTTHLVGCLQFNQARLASPQNPINGETTNTVANIVQRLPIEGIAPGSYTCQSTFDARYDSLQASLTKRMSHGLEFLASYTWSKNLDAVSGSGGLSNFELGFLTNDQTNQKQARGLSDNDHAHRAVLSLSYALPHIGTGPQMVRAFTSNWRIATVAVAQSGSPITVTDFFAGQAYGNLAGFMRAQCTGVSPATAGSIRDRASATGRYLNVAAFTDAPMVPNGVDIGGGNDIGTKPTDFGNCGVGILRGPRQQNIDFALEKSFRVKESGAIQFRMEAFNLTNTPSFGNPDSGYRSGDDFGRINNTVSAPRVLQMALKYSF